jgi:hypothetical protein
VSRVQRGESERVSTWAKPSPWRADRRGYGSPEMATGSGKTVSAAASTGRKQTARAKRHQQPRRSQGCSLAQRRRGQRPHLQQTPKGLPARTHRVGASQGGCQRRRRGLVHKPDCMSAVKRSKARCEVTERREAQRSGCIKGLKPSPESLIDDRE